MRDSRPNKAVFFSPFFAISSSFILLLLVRVMVMVMVRGRVRVSNGSFIDREGTTGLAGWIIKESIEGNQLRGQQETPGSEMSQCLHRSDMWRVLGIVMMANKFCTRHNITQGSITAKCNGEGTIKILQQLHFITKNSHKHFDII